MKGKRNKSNVVDLTTAIILSAASVGMTVNACIKPSPIRPVSISLLGLTAVVCIIYLITTVASGKRRYRNDRGRA